MPAKKPTKRREVRPPKSVKRYEPPKKGERLRQSDLYPTTRKGFKRISQIYGIPLKELTPFVELGMKGVRGALSEGLYYRKRHTISLEPTSFKPSLTMDHESWHALENLLRKARGKMDREEQFKRWEKKHPGSLKEDLKKELKKLITPSEYIRGLKRGPKSLKEDLKLLRRQLKELKRIRTLAEPTADVNHPSSTRFIRAFRPVRFLSLFTLAVFINPALFALLAGDFAAQTARNFIAKGFYKRHGVDGLLLIFAYPPKKCDVIMLRAHEKKLVKEGYLKKDSGMTKKGMQLLRKLVPREVIIKRAKGVSKKSK